MISRYLLGQVPPAHMVERYVHAHRTLCRGGVRSPELEFVHRHQFMVGPLEAAAGLLRPQSTLRTKIFLMTSILEATPDYADFFLPKPSRRPLLIGKLIGLGVRSVFKLCIGVPVFLCLRRLQ